MDRKRVLFAAALVVLVAAGAIYLSKSGEAPLPEPVGDPPVFIEFMTPT